MNLARFSLVLALLLPLSLKADLVAHWKLDEGTGTTAADETANALTGTIAGGTTWTLADLPPVPSGTTAALEMDGVDDQVNIVGYKGITGTGDRTIAAWIKSGINSTALNKAIVSWGSNVGTQKWTFRVQTQNGTAGAIRIEVNGGFFVGNTVVTDGEWHHVAVTWANDGSPDVIDAKLYVDGVLDAEFGNIDTPPSASQSSAVNTASGSDVRIGDDFQLDHNWQGSMDDVRIYDEALDAIAIEALAIGTPVLTSFEASEEAVSSGSPVQLSWVSDPGNDTLSIDNGVGDVLGQNMVTVNPTATTTYTITGTRGADNAAQEVLVLVDSAPLINEFESPGTLSILEGDSVTLVWDVYGEATVTLNGNDVTGEELAMLSPTETTTYTLAATNAFGTTTQDLVVTVLGGDSPNLSWSAEGIADGVLNQWTPVINATGNNGLVFNQTTGGEVQSGASNFSGISSWVNSPGYNLDSNPGDSWQDGLGDLVTKEDVTWEMVMRPGDFTGTHTLFNTGGNGFGTAFVLIDGTLEFRFQAANSDAQRVVVSTDLSAIGAATDFYHIVGTADVGAGVPGIGELYVNGQLVAGPTTSTGIINDWDGNDLAELGKGANIPGNGSFPFEAFTGDIALFNYYESRILDSTRISELYTALGGGGTAELAITEITYDAEASEIRLTFNSIPGRFYALESTTDLSAPFWLELDDSIASEGTETTYVIPGVVLPDAGNPRVFYRVLPGLN